MNALAGLFGFIPGWIWAAICAGAVATSCVQGQRLEREQGRHATTKADFATYRADTERQAREASEQARQKEQELSHAVHQAQAQADALRADLDRSRDAAGVAAGRLRDAAAQAAAASARCADSTAAAVGETAASAARVLADVLAEIDQRSGVLAETADRSRAVGLQCEALHDAAVNATR